MKALLLKDWYCYKKGPGWLLTSIAFILMLLPLFGDVNNYFLLFIVSASILSINSVLSIDIDRNTLWDIHNCVLPFSKEELVKSKYLFALFNIIGSFLLFAFSQIIELLKNGKTLNQCASNLTVTVFIVILFSSVFLSDSFSSATVKNMQLESVLAFLSSFMLSVFILFSGERYGFYSSESSAFDFSFEGYMILIISGIFIFGLSMFFSMRPLKSREL